MDEANIIVIKENMDEANIIDYTIYVMLKVINFLGKMIHGRFTS